MGTQTTGQQLMFASTEHTDSAKVVEIKRQLAVMIDELNVGFPPDLSGIHRSLAINCLVEASMHIEKAYALLNYEE